MAEQRITITIDEMGKLEARTEGFQGSVCVDALNEILGEETDIQSIKKTDEYFQQQRQQTKNTLSLKQR